MLPLPIINKYGNTVTIENNIIKVQSNLNSSTYVLYSSGELYGWGANSQYTLGTGNNTPVTTPTLLLSNIKDVWLGVNDALALTNDGKILCCGIGTLFDSANVQRASWTDVSSYFSSIGIANIKKIDINAGCLAVLDTSNRLYASGDNTYAKYAASATTRYATPTLILSVCYDMHGNGNNGLFTLRSDSKIYAGGSNSAYQLGTTAANQIFTTIIYTPYTFQYPGLSLTNVLYTSRLSSFINNTTMTGGGNDSNRVRFAGSNNSGQLSININNNTNYNGFSNNSTLPSGIDGSAILKGYSSYGNFVSPVLQTATGIYQCGYGGYGQHGNGGTGNLLVYTRNSSIDSIISDYSKLKIWCVGFYSSYFVYENKLYGTGGGAATNINTELPGYNTLQTSFVRIALPLDPT